MADAPDMETESENPTCEVCGKPAVVEINSVARCEECYHEMGSCCGEWNEKDEP